MSYAEQHIFLAGRSLTPTEREHADSLSSHAVVGPNYAIYTYFYGGSFRGSETEMLTETYDAMLWEDSCESFHLRFRLPKDVVPPEELLPYITQGEYPAVEINVTSAGNNTILSIRCNIEEGERVWIEENPEPLRKLMPIRAGLLTGDYRILYLIHQYNQLVDEENEEDTADTTVAALSVPVGLNELPEYLINFGHRCGFIPEEIVKRSPQSESIIATDYDHNLQFLDKDRMLEYLRGILNEEPDLAAKLRRELAGFDGGIG